MRLNFSGLGGALGKARLARFCASGQGLAIDFLFAVMLFLLLLNASLVLIEGGSKNAADKGLLNELNAKAVLAADRLVRSEGEPSDWQDNGIEGATAIGLAKRDRVLDQAKVERLAEWAQSYSSADYNRVKQLLLVGYDYYFRLGDSGGATLYETGKPSPGRIAEMSAINVRRIANLNGGEVVVEFTIYYPWR